MRYAPYERQKEDVAKTYLQKNRQLIIEKAK